MTSEDYGSSDTSSIVSTSEASVTSDESLTDRTGHDGCKLIVKKRYSIHNVHLSNVNNAAVGPRSKIIGLLQGRGAGLGLPYADTSQSTNNESGASPPEEDNYDRVPEENVIRLSERISGSYCLSSLSDLPYVERGTEWNPRPSKGILENKGEKVLQWTIRSFFDNPDRFIQKMDISADLCKEQREQFILLEVLPHLEKSWGKCSSYNEQVYKNLSKISCSVNSGTVVRHALQLLFRLICQDNFSNGHRNLLVVEAIIRSSIFSSEGMFRKDEHSERNLKLFVYSRVLSLLLIQQVKQGELTIVDLEEDLKKLHKELRRRCGQLKNKKKDIFRYSMEFTVKMISHLLKPYDRLTSTTKIKFFMEECQEFCGDSNMESKDLKILRTLGEKKRNVEWVDLHCILIHLHGKVHSERPVPQMETERRAMKLIRLIVEAYLQGGGGDDWRFCLLASSILVDIGMNNATKEMRKEAGGCIVNLLKDEKVQKKRECRAILEQKSSEMLFCPDSGTRRFLVPFLTNLRGTLQADQHTERLSTTYRTQTLEINKTTIRQSLSCFVNHGMFQGRKVAVKILYVKKKHLVEDDPKFQARERLIREVYNMRRLNASQHPNLAVLLGYDTKTLPYHLITEFERWGNLLQFVRNFRERDPPLQPVQLLKMLIDISDALLYLEELGLVHRAVMAENVLVGDNFVCKLNGLQSLQQLDRGPSVTDSASLYGYCTAEVPKFIITESDEDLPVRWKAPECLTEHRYSTSSDVWAFGVLMYEVLTYGCIPYRNVLDDDEVPSRVVDSKEIIPCEKCFEGKEYELMKQCCEWQFHRRPKLPAVNARLKEMFKCAEEDKSRPGPPPLGIQQNSDLQDAEEIYSFIQDHHEDEERNEEITRKTVQGLPTIWEKIYSQADGQHLEGLVGLNNPNLASVWRVENLGLHHCIISPEGRFGNLKEYVLNRRCQQGDIVMFLSQVASALHYLHTKHIVHGDLRAEYVNVVAQDKVQVGRLGRSRPVSTSAYEITSTSCVVEAAMPPDATRWSAPEVILDGYYTHASDVWAFGILAWELYTSYLAGQDRRDLSLPYNSLNDDEILPYMRGEGPLNQPEGCPDWVYIIMHQCWAFDSAQRPPFLAIVDCLTSREPMESWLMQLWLRNHDESVWPDLSICQPSDACHVLDAAKHPSKKNIEQMCSDDFFAEHRYRYDDAGDEEFVASCSTAENLDKSVYSSPYSRRKEISGYSRTADKKTNGDGTCKENKAYTAFYTSDDPAGYKRHHSEICQNDHSSTITYETVYSHVKKKKCIVDHHNADPGVSSPDEDDHPKYDKPTGCICIPEDCTHLAECHDIANKPNPDDNTVYDKPATNISTDCSQHGEHKNKAHTLDQGDCSTYDKPRSISKDCTCSAEYLNAAALRQAQDGSLEEGKGQTISPSSGLPICENPGVCTLEDCTHLAECQNKAYTPPDLDDCNVCNKPAAIHSNECTQPGKHQNKANKLDQDDCSISDKSICLSEDCTYSAEYLKMAALRQAKHDCSLEESKSQAIPPSSGLPKCDISEDCTCSADEQDVEALRLVQNGSFLEARKGHAIPPSSGLPKCENPAVCIPEDCTCSAEYQNMAALRQAQNDSALEARKGQAIPPRSGLPRGRRNNAPGSQMNCQSENKENVCEITTLGFHRLPQSEHVYANMQSKVQTRNLGMESACNDKVNLLQEDNAHGIFDDHDDGAGAQRHKSTLQTLLNDPSLEVEFYV